MANTLVRGLSQKEQLIFQTAALQADLSVAALARQLSMKQHVVRRALERFFELGIFLGKRVYINPAALGLVEYIMFLSLIGASQKLRDDFVSFLVKSEHVSILAEVGGDFQYEVRFLSRNQTDFMQFLDSLANNFTVKIQAKDIALLHSEEYSGVKLISHNALKLPRLSYGPVASMVAIDELDHKILNLLSNSSFASERELAQRIGIPTSTVYYRLDNLRRRGLIIGYYYICDTKPMRQLPFSLLIYSSLMKEGKRARLLQFCRNHLNVAYLDITIGAWSARVFVRVASYEEALAVMHELYHEFSGEIDAIKVMPQLRFYKASGYPFDNIKSAAPLISFAK